MCKILIVYYFLQKKRTTIIDHLYSFDRYSRQECYYFNLAIPRNLSILKKVKFDLIVFHTSFLSLRWNLYHFQRFSQKIDFLKKSDAIKLVIPQDEFLQTLPLCKFINEFSVNYIFSVSPPSEWSKIYHDINHEKIKIYGVLTGYLEDKTINRIKKLSAQNISRNIDIGYRSWKAEYWLGRHGFLKAKIAEVFNQEATKFKLNVDISTREEDTFFGDDWYKFLLNSKYTIGLEGGASILDKDGSIRERTNQYLQINPNANFTEVEQACFPNIDGKFNLFALSPRHLEACITQTCQILIEGNYNGILQPSKHYLELKADFSNLDEILHLVKQDNLRQKITCSAYEDIVLSGRYTYQTFVRFILKTSLEDALNNQLYVQNYKDVHCFPNFIYIWFKITDSFGWYFVSLLLVYVKLKSVLNSYLPSMAIKTIKSIKNKINFNT